METIRYRFLANPILGGLLVFGVALGLAGCTRQKSDEFKTQETGVKVKHKELHEHGPHGGHVTDLGAGHQYRVELTYKKEPRTITVYVMEHDSDKAVALETQAMTLELEGEGKPQNVTLSAKPEDDDPADKSSRFAATGQEIPASIQDLEDIHGHLKVQVGEKTLEAEFGHDHEEHAD